jgi:hypothetical protein
MKNFNDTIGNRTRDLSVCSAVPQPTQLPILDGTTFLQETTQIMKKARNV